MRAPPECACGSPFLPVVVLTDLDALTQRGECPKSLTANGGGGAVENLGHLGVGQVEVVTKHHDRALSWPECHQRTLQVSMGDQRGVGWLLDSRFAAGENILPRFEAVK